MPLLKKILKTVIISIIILVTVIMLGVLYYFQIYRAQPEANPVEFDHSVDISEFEDVLPDTIRRLRIDNLYWEIRLDMAGDETIDLLLDLVSREIFIEIQGVTVYTTPVYYYTLSDSLRGLLNSDSLYDWLSEPCTLQSEWATIAKEPIQVREIRPRSTGENGLTRFRDPEVDQYVYILLEFSGKLSLKFSQIEAATDSMEKPESPRITTPYYVEILLSRSSAQTIYRAISINNSNLALRPE